MMKLAKVSLLLSLPFALSCASTGDAIRADAELVRRESTPAVLARRGDAFAAVHDATRAEQYYAAALAGGGDAPVLVRRLMRVCIADQRYRAALAHARDYLRRYPDDQEVRFARATVAAGVGEIELAYGDLTQLSKAAPGNADVQFALAVLLRDELADSSKAREHFARYLALAPRGTNAAQARVAMTEEAIR